VKYAPSTLLALSIIPLLASGQSVLRVNQLGYLPRSVKVAVLLSRDPLLRPLSFELHDVLTGKIVMSSDRIESCGAYAGFPQTFRLDFSTVASEGGYFIQCGELRSLNFRIASDVYDGTADFLLRYLRQQRCGYNPYLKDSCHTRDGYVVYSPALDSTFVDVVGGWHDAADYLKYVTTTATAVFQMLFAYRENPSAFGDRFDKDGHPSANGIPDILDEAKWGLDWLVKMYPRKDRMFNQVADDRDHLGFRLPNRDTTGYGRGHERPVYTCTGRPQGVMQYKNRSTGLASTAGKFSSSFSLGASVLARYYPEYATVLREKAMEAYDLGRAYPGVCQTAPCRAPYFYEEENWVDDMELAATQLHTLLHDTSYLVSALHYARKEPVTPWMGSDSARHYQWYPFVNLGHYLLARDTTATLSRECVRWMREGLERIYTRAKLNPFLFGIPFIWCSNNYVSATLMQLRLYHKLTGDTSYQAMEASLRDWLSGCNPWGTSMIIGLPEAGTSPRDPHSAFSHLYHYPVDGGLVDGPVKRSIFESLKGIQLSRKDPFAEYQSAIAVYHDDWGDYSTNEPTMDGTASLTYYLSALESQGGSGSRKRGENIVLGGITRMDSTKKEIYLVFTGHEFADGGEIIRTTLKNHTITASFFFTGDFYRNPEYSPLVARLRKDGHYLGAHSDKHLLYASWDNRDSLLVTKEEFLEDLRANYGAMQSAGIERQNARFFMPPFEWYNRSISDWCKEAGLTLVNFTPGTSSNADYTFPGMEGGYVPSDTIQQRILTYEARHVHGLDGFILLTHVGTDPRRTDKFYFRLERLIAELKRRGYQFRSFNQ
jgi:endoglucanase